MQMISDSRNSLTEDDHSAFVWTPSVCESFSSQTARNATSECWETCDWSGNENDVDKADDWRNCSDWSLDDADSADKSFSVLTPKATSTPTKSRISKFQLADSVVQSAELSSLSQFAEVHELLFQSQNLIPAVLLLMGMDGSCLR